MNSNLVELSVASVTIDGPGQVSEHAMVLDTYDMEKDVLIFKNTYDDNGQTKKYRIERTHPNAPKELYFVHIDVKDMENLPSENERIENKEKEIEARKKKC